MGGGTGEELAGDTIGEETGGAKES
ncbi:hypothetical protein TIFTF001_041102 [Ficus carica]|uniref:Uncharacterized protein n=1 Tax=Ficus carica TaxID=3494 RepID=A0AA88CS14_FICCA|nr:hypothetical protein TIFTF001_041102 [Ficus carica]